MFGLAALCFLLLQTGAFGFQIYFFGVGLWSSSSLTHETITQRAILNVTVQACRALARAEGKDFTFPPLNAESVAVACEASKSSKSFSEAIKLIQKINRHTGTYYFYSAPHHFDDEQFLEGRRLITEGLSVVKASNKRDNFVTAREKLGRILHPLQDFYSHSNWVEMGNKLPNSNLFREGTSIGNIAAKDRATCRNCDGDDCRNNILEDILQEKILISGYFAFNLPLISSYKPEGKCSHGGFGDKTSKTEPKGGISKDKVGSDHGHLYITAANMAIAATSELLEDIRGAAGDKTFLQLMGINKGSSKALCFVIDTTGSMSDDIDAVRAVTSSIIDSKVGTEDAPSLYILVPFNDPDFGPLLKTTDPNVFKNAIDSLRAEGGGDSPEMSLSGLQLALAGAPPESEIFLFTDAPAKDTHLKSTVIALIERTKSVVNFMITAVLRSRFGRLVGDSEQQQSRMGVSDATLYRDLAQVSGGLAIEVTKAELPAATSIITQSSTSSLVTLLQANRNPGKADNFTFSVDESVRNITVYITGTSTTFSLTNPSGVSQESTNNRGPLITASQSVGNFQTLQLKAETGLWEIKFVSTNPYMLKVVGVSAIDFLFDFLEVSQDPIGGLEIIDNRPRAGVNGSLLVTVTGSDTATLTEVILVESSGLRQVNGSVEAMGGGNYFARFDRIPAEEFVVLVKGQNNNGSSRATSVNLQRQSTTSIRASTVSVRSPVTTGVLEPGTPLSVSFSVATSGAGGTFSIQATNDQNFDLSFPSSLIVETGSTANGAVNITAPSNTPSGTDVTLTIEAEAPGGAGANYVVLRFTVLTPVTDFAPPVCQNVSLQSTCSDSCSSSMWELSVQVTDGDGGSGVDRVSLRQGNGTLNTSLAAGNITMVSYDASCFSPDVELVVVDEVGNVATCFYSITRTVVVTATTQSPKVPTAAPGVSLSSRAVPSFLLCFCITILGFNLPF